MNTNDTGSRRASPFARGPVATSPNSPAAVPPAAPKEPLADSPVSAAKPNAPAAAPGAGGGRASPFASRSATTPASAPPPLAEPPKEIPSQAESTSPASSRLAGRMGARPGTAPGTAPGAQVAESAAQTAPAGKRRAAPPRRDRPKTTPPTMPKEIPGTVEPKVKALLFAMTQLVSVLAEENDALDQHDTNHVRTLMESKMLKTRYYQEQMLAVHGNPRLLLDLNEEQREVMRGAAKTLDAIAQQNGRKLKANIEASNRLMKCVMNAVNEQAREKATTYSKDGEVEADPSQAYRKAVTFNETL